FYTMSVFAGLYPRVMVSSLNPEWSLTIYNAASSPYTLKIMTIAAFILVPVVLLYQGWTYWVFRHRVSEKDISY
ncbi:MAG: cytochrome d ubiquinol oxidase subunit II, partial [Dehalobacterium sp.]